MTLVDKQWWCLNNGSRGIGLYSYELQRWQWLVNERKWQVVMLMGEPYQRCTARQLWRSILHAACGVSWLFCASTWPSHSHIASAVPSQLVTHNEFIHWVHSLTISKHSEFIQNSFTSFLQSLSIFLFPSISSISPWKYQSENKRPWDLQILHFLSALVGWFSWQAEFFMLDTNMMDSHPKHADPRHNICGQQNNPPGASCSATGGPKNLDDCFKFMWETRLQVAMCQVTASKRTNLRTLPTFWSSAIWSRLF